MCTANQCRSPIGETLLRIHLADAGIEADVSSAGLLTGGAPPTKQAIDTMAKVGLDISGHVSRQITPALLEDRDLIITMTRQHLIELTLMVPSAWPRMFQIRDLVRRAEEVGARDPGQRWADWVAAVGDGRTRSGILAASLSDDIADPVGLSLGVFERTRDDIDGLLTRLVALL